MPIADRGRGRGSESIGDSGESRGCGYELLDVGTTIPFTAGISFMLTAMPGRTPPPARLAGRPAINFELASYRRLFVVVDDARLLFDRKKTAGMTGRVRSRRPMHRARCRDRAIPSMIGVRKNERAI